MIQRLISHFWSVRHQFAKYFLIGFSAFILDMGSLYLLKEYGHISAVFAVMINQLFMANYVFFLNKHWSFKARGVTHRQMVKFGILTGFNYIFSIVWMWILNHRLGVYYMFARVANVILAVAWNFLLYKYWVYHHGSVDGDKVAEERLVVED